MGFGPLLVGYLFLLNPGIYDGLTNLLGYCFILYGMLSLRVYNRGLRVAFIAALLLFIPGIPEFYLTARSFFGAASLPDAWNSAFAVAKRLTQLFFTLSLFCGIESLGKETGLPEIRNAAVRNRFFSALYFLFAAALELPTYFPSATEFAVHAVIPVVVCGFAVVLLNSYTIFSCYRYICLPSDTLPDDLRGQNAKADPTVHDDGKRKK